MYRVYDCIAHSTKKLTWVNSGSVPSSIACTLRTFDDTLISSVTATGSGNGHYYAEVSHPGSRQWLVNEWIAVINGNTYAHRQFGHVIYPTAGALP